MIKNKTEMPFISEELVKALRATFPSDIRYVDSLDDLNKAKGRQEIIDFLAAISNKQRNGES